MPNVSVTLGNLCVRGIVVMGHSVRLLVAAPHADVYLKVQFKLNIGWFNQLEPQFPAAEDATRRGRWLNEGAHSDLLPSDLRRSEGRGALKGAPIEKFKFLKTRTP